MITEDIIGGFKETLREKIDEFSEIINNYMEKLSEIERAIEDKKDRLEIWRGLQEVRNLTSELKLKRIELKQDLKAKFLETKRSIKEHAERSPEEIETVGEQLENLSDLLEDALDDVEDEVDSFADRAEELAENLREKIRSLKHTKLDVIVSSSPMELKIPQIRVPEIKIPDVGRLIEESLSRAWTGGPSAIVSSVRLPQADLNLIDALVNAGIFKSKNEGIAFFAHKGIEGSKEWLAKVKEKLDEIRKLQEETKHELEKVLGESKSETGEEGEKGS